MVQAEQHTRDVVEQGRAGSGRNVVSRPETTESGSGSPAPDVKLQQIIRRHQQLGDEPQQFDFAAHDRAFEDDGAHTITHHGPQLPLARQPNVQTVEGRIYGETGWDSAKSRSYKWTDVATMNIEVNRYVRENWTAIRDDLAFDGFHDGIADAGHRIGEGYYNKGMFGAGPRAAAYQETSVFRVRIRIVEGSDPPMPFVVSAFPAGLG